MDLPSYEELYEKRKEKKRVLRETLKDRELYKFYLKSHDEDSLIFLSNHFSMLESADKDLCSSNKINIFISAGISVVPSLLVGVYFLNTQRSINFFLKSSI